ncbi:hypothetical protein H6G80_01890 [Nostoc sp. FACHB-87]|uniref:hypothetical protein n=1 Tax=Nostocaceae TaxID=1162 RepID=UPI0016891F8F|nr:MULTISPECIES: hypothetical protein [Nostocaceae]MBD2452853.1 hypothetical protein [Nostoc sp. FACHB-87]MBD2473784.1 hypothetical protein [Anabaena sp. FACHB-83]
MDFSRLEYIKNISDDGKKWAYEYYKVSGYYHLNFKQGKGVENHALHLPKGALIILSQNPFEQERYLTHVVELVNEGSEDKLQWDESEQWGIFRWVKVHWVADFNNPSKIPVDKEVMQANWGLFDTKAKLLTGEKLMSRWGNIENLRTHLQAVFEK